MATGSESSTGEVLDRELAGLLDVETFDPPAEFRERALLKDPEVYERAARDPQAWWVEQAERLHWSQKWDKVLDGPMPNTKWFVGGKLNVSYNCLDRHVEAGTERGTPTHWEGEPDGSERRAISYAELRPRCARFANVLKDLGVDNGDRRSRSTCRWCPSSPIAMLACARLGAPHTVVFGGFSADALCRSNQRHGLRAR